MERHGACACCHDMQTRKQAQEPFNRNPLVHDLMTARSNAQVSMCLCCFVCGARVHYSLGWLEFCF